jgi:hypothetical protein
MRCSKSPLEEHFVSDHSLVAGCKNQNRLDATTPIRDQEMQIKDGVLFMQHIDFTIFYILRRVIFKPDFNQTLRQPSTIDE